MGQRRITVSEDERTEESNEDETTDQGRREMLKSAAALAAAALGGAALATGGEAEAQVEGLQTQPRLDPEQISRLQQMQASPLVKDLGVQELPLRNLGRAVEGVNQEGLNAFARDLQEYLQPRLDKHGGQVSDVGINVASSVTVSG